MMQLRSVAGAAPWRDSAHARAGRPRCWRDPRSPGTAIAIIRAEGPRGDIKRPEIEDRATEPVSAIAAESAAATMCASAAPISGKGAIGNARLAPV